MNEPAEVIAAQRPDDGIGVLRDAVERLLASVSGPVASVSLRAGPLALDISWERPPAAPGPETQPEPAAADATGRTVSASAGGHEDAVRDVAAPLVGTFYAAPGPGERPFVAVHDKVEQGQAVGIVEAMKLLNEVRSEWSGEVVEILVGDGEPVEFGQPLVRIKVDPV